MSAETSVYPTPKSDRSTTRADIALLVSALFLQRFSLPFGATFLQLVFVAFGFILLHQFLSGKLLIRYDRLLWFLGAALAITCPLLLNFKSTMLSSYFQIMFLYSLFTLSRPSTPGLYKSTLRAFQFLVMLLSCLGVAQFIAQFVVDGRQLIFFYGMVPDILFEYARGGGQATIRELGNGLIKSNGIFLAEASALSQITALGILVEVLEFRRPRYLLTMALGFLVAYSGTGLMILLLFLPLAGLRHGKAGASVLLVVISVLGLFATGIIDLSAFLSRAGEFEDTRTSGFLRFIAPLWLAAKEFDTASLLALLLGNGPGTAKIVASDTLAASGYGGYVSPWFKMFYEYGIIGFFIIFCFVASCLRRSRCPGLVVVAIVFTWLFTGGEMFTMMVLCTLNGPEPRGGRIGETSQYQPSVVAGSAAG
jgi:hypothetical protein